MPRITVTDPNLINEILLDKFGLLGRFGNVHPLGRFLSSGVISYEGAKWVKHRKILNPAFHAEKLKVSENLIRISSQFHFPCNLRIHVKV